eukprot:SAG31_NODE_3909_length_3762_cov_2.740923_7_plen_183_part_00
MSAAASPGSHYGAGGATGPLALLAPVPAAKGQRRPNPRRSQNGLRQGHSAGSIDDALGGYHSSSGASGGGLNSSAPALMALPGPRAPTGNDRPTLARAPAAHAAIGGGGVGLPAVTRQHQSSVARNLGLAASRPAAEPRHTPAASKFVTRGHTPGHGQTPPPPMADSNRRPVPRHRRSEFIQ